MLHMPFAALHCQFAGSSEIVKSYPKYTGIVVRSQNLMS